jgi:hypothetical protein
MNERAYEKKRRMNFVVVVSYFEEYKEIFA